jgi:hypothetical protein
MKTKQQRQKRTKSNFTKNGYFKLYKEKYPKGSFEKKFLRGMQNKKATL